MNDDLAKLLEDPEEYDETKEVDSYDEYAPKKMTKKEFVREMLRLQEERKLYSES